MMILRVGSCSLTSNGFRFELARQSSPRAYGQCGSTATVRARGTARGRRDEPHPADLTLKIGVIGKR